MATENYQIYIECTLYILKEHQGAIYSSLSLRIAMIQYDDRIQSERTSHLYYKKWRRYSARPQCILVACGPLIPNWLTLLSLGVSCLKLDINTQCYLNNEKSSVELMSNKQNIMSIFIKI